MSQQLEPTIRFLRDRNDQRCEEVRRWLREHNWKRNEGFMSDITGPDSEAEPLTLIAEVNGRVVGGMFAERQLAWLRISIMSVDPACRGRGVGTALLLQAEAKGIEAGCRYSYLDTMDYQAPEFYARHGYEVMGRIPDWDSHGHAKIFMVKMIGSETSATADD